MIKMILHIDGMACGMCESHINDVVRKEGGVKKVTSSFRKGITEIIAEQALDEDAIRTAIQATGYTVTGIETEPYEKKGFSLFRGKAKE